MKESHFIAVIDLGSQTTMLIARRIRELGVMAKILPTSVKAEELKKNGAKAIVLSGSPVSLLEKNALDIDGDIFDLNIPILGICYGMQLIVNYFQGRIIKASIREFGQREINICADSLLFDGVNDCLNVWMSHSDQVDLSKTKFLTLASSKSCPHAAIQLKERKIYGVQFHPEVSHSDHGEKILSNFIFKITDVEKNFSIGNFLDNKISEIKQQVNNSHVIMGLSGGVDSSVAAALIHRAIENNLHCVYVNHGLHRQGEIDEIKNLFGQTLKMDLHIIDAKEQFFSALKGIHDPEQKRKIIGSLFIQAFEKEAARFKNITFLGQGTLYPDVIESQGEKAGYSHVIKSHHNVGGLPKLMRLRLLEPLRDLFKDEVKKLGLLLGLSNSVLLRQPFPGPGLAVRIPGEITKERVMVIKKADAIVRQEIEEAYKEKKLKTMWQWFAILLPIKSVGIMGDARSYGDSIVIRCVESIDAMSADWAKVPYEILGRISSRITNEVPNISRVLYDVTQKPPGTIEWE
jgi:GMP synthase (glutamine-hydrolysing)